jgi:hypothetical protein
MWKMHVNLPLSIILFVLYTDAADTSLLASRFSVSANSDLSKCLNYGVFHCKSAQFSAAWKHKPKRQKYSKAIKVWTNWAEINSSEVDILTKKVVRTTRVKLI